VVVIGVSEIHIAGTEAHFVIDAEARTASGPKSGPSSSARIVGGTMRRTPLRDRARSAYRERERHTAYMLWVKRQPCLMRGVWGCCSGPVEADHAGPRGVGRKAHDSTCIPLCRYHHAASRFPRSWAQPQRRAWLHAAVVYTQACARARGVFVPPDLHPMSEYPVTAIDVARTALEAASMSMCTNTIQIRD
jgi:hypothetical protein